MGAKQDTKMSHSVQYISAQETHESGMKEKVYMGQFLQDPLSDGVVTFVPLLASSSDRWVVILKTMKRHYSCAFGVNPEL